MKIIKLSKGKSTLVDDNIFEYLNQWKWHLSARGYAVRKPGKKCIFMHRLINKTPNDLQTDHINKDKLDNRKENLRTVTNQKNHFNMPLQKNSTSGYTGICFDKSRNKYMSYIEIGGKRHYLGRFKTILEAYYKRIEMENLLYVI